MRRLRRDTAAVVTVIAGAGYGKTTLLAQWAAAETRPVAWLSIEARDNDPGVLLTYLDAAVDRVQPLDPRLLGSLGAARRSGWESAVARSEKALATAEPFLLIVDNADLLQSPEALRVFSILTAHLPRGSTLALAARTTAGLPIPTRGGRRGLRELGVDELAMTKRDAQLLLQRAIPGLSEQQTGDLIELCDGWPAALYLASLSVVDPAAEAAHDAFGGSDRHFAEYVRSQYLSQLGASDLRFLRRASILDEVTGPLCETVLREDDSEARLQKLARANLVLMPLDGGRRGYRYHPLFRQFLLRELEDEEPQVIPALHRRAAAFYERMGDADAALAHAEGAGDADHVAALISAIALPAASQGRTDETERILARFSETWELARYPGVALQGSWLHAFRGRAIQAERWLEIAGRGARRRSGEAVACRAALPVVRAALCRNGVRQMVADSGAALAQLRRASVWYPQALHMRGCAAMLIGAEDEADSLLAEAARAAAVRGCPETQMIAVSQRSVLARWRDDLDAADALAAEATEILTVAELENCPTSAIALAASARAKLRHGRWAEARDLVDAAAPLRSSVTEALPWLALGLRLELLCCYLTLRDVPAARAVVGEIDAVLDVRPGLGVLVPRARELCDEAAAFARSRAGSHFGLTPAELRLLPLLATHLSFREIAEQLTVSRNTVKTQAISIYRKLGVTSRSDAIRATTAGSAKAA